MRLARVKYLVTSHDPFDASQAAGCLSPPQQPPRYRASLVVDALLEGDWASVAAALAAAGEAQTLVGVRSLLRRCIARVRPEFLNAATPHTFTYEHPERAGPPPRDGAELGERRLTAAPIEAAEGVAGGAKGAEGGGRWEPTAQIVLDFVVLPLCRELGLPLSLRMGTRRAVNPSLALAGDGVGPAQLDSLRQLCEANPRVKFMATVLCPANRRATLLPC